MKRLIKHCLEKVYLDHFSRDFLLNLKNTKRHLLWNYKRKFGQVDRSLIENYLSTHDIKKLHIGCGIHILDDWLNSDYYQWSHKILHLDATTRFPFELETFNYIFSEHMIEHITYANGIAMLEECYRVLKKGGKIRVSTPDMQFLIDLYKSDKSKLQTEYIKWTTDGFIGDAPYYDDTFVINNFVRDWGHLFIYDEKTLRSSLEKVGFTEIIRCDLNESGDEIFRNLEHEERMPDGFLKLESFTLEAVKA